MKIDKTNDCNISLSDFGLKVEINPSRMFNSQLDSDTSEYLDKILEKEYKRILSKVKQKYGDVLSDRELSNNLKEQKDDLIYQVSMFIRHISRLHSDLECIELSEEEIEIRDWCYDIYKYKTVYGFKSSTTQEVI